MISFPTKLTGFIRGKMGARVRDQTLPSGRARVGKGSGSRLLDSVVFEGICN